MPAEQPPARRDALLFAVGVALWLAAQLATWPVALSFGDEIGYVGQSRALLDGHLRPQPGDAGIWLQSDHGPVGKYPLFLPLIIAPLCALGPRLMFAVGIFAALALALIGARILRMWGRSPVWALLLLAHPTVVVIARTVMVDVMLAAFAVGAWYALARERRVAAGVLTALIVAAKPPGIMIAAALIAGEAVQLWRTLPLRGLLARLAPLGIGIAAGVALTAALNVVATGTPWYGYAKQDVGAPLFSLTHIPQRLPWHAAGLLLSPPLLIAGVWPLWRRRALGPLFVVVGLVAAMSCYVFVDRGRSFAETLVLAPRLILPAVAILIIGYADVLAGLVARFPAFTRWVSVVIVVLPALVCWTLASRHRRWQEAPAEALASAHQLAAALDQRELGLMGGSFKAGMLFPGRIVAVDGTPGSHPAVVLCGEESSSHRQPGRVFHCDLPGYDDRPLPGGFHLLVRSQRR